MAVPAEKTDAFYSVREKEAGYEEACDFTRRVFASKLECQLGSFYPEIFVKRSADGIAATCGVRRAGDSALFLEQYLDGPIEGFLPGIPREDIIEIGGFAATGKLEALQLMGWTALTLYNAGYTHVACTANRSIRSCLTRLGIQFDELSGADREKLAESASHDEWGRYYDTAPLVLAGSVASGVEAILSRNSQVECVN